MKLISTSSNSTCFKPMPSPYCLPNSQNNELRYKPNYWQFSFLKRGFVISFLQHQLCGRESLFLLHVLRKGVTTECLMTWCHRHPHRRRYVQTYCKLNACLFHSIRNNMRILQTEWCTQIPATPGSATIAIQMHYFVASMSFSKWTTKYFYFLTYQDIRLDWTSFELMISYTHSWFHNKLQQLCMSSIKHILCLYLVHVSCTPKYWLRLCYHESCIMPHSSCFTYSCSQLSAMTRREVGIIFASALQTTSTF